MVKTPRLKSKHNTQDVLTYLLQVDKTLGILEYPSTNGHRVKTTAADWSHAVSEGTWERMKNIVQNVETLRWAIATGQEGECPHTLGQITSVLPKVTRSVRRLFRTGFQRGFFRVVIMSRLGAYHTREILRGIDEASNLLQNRFPHVLYGDLYLTPGRCKTKGGLVTTNDSIVLSPQGKTLPPGWHTYAVLHELGHRYYWEFWRNSAEIREFMQLSTDSKFWVSKYGGKDANENFAEAFAHYALGKPLHPEIQAIMDRLE